MVQQSTGVAPHTSSVPPGVFLGGNILLMVLDDIGIEVLTSYGEGLQPAPTPNLDALAAKGVLFRYAYGNPLCSPTRATIQTGRYGFRTGVGHLVKKVTAPMPLSEVTIPQVLDRGNSGYEHAAIGKWHLGNNTVGGVRSPNRAGWGHYTGVLANPGSYTTWTKVVNGYSAIASGYITTDDVDEALAWIGSKHKPWLCYVAFASAHTPYHAPPTHLHGFTLANPAPVAGEDPIPYFHAMVETLDTEIGRLLQGIDLDATTVLVVGDNGSQAKAVTPPFNPLQNKATVYEGGTRVPLIVRSPHVSRPGRTVNAMVNTTDLFATVLELANVDLSGLDLPTNDSVSLVPYLLNPNQKPLRTHTFSEKFRPNGPGPYHVLNRAIRDERYKLATFHNSRDELYDLLMDPYERKPLPLAKLTAQEAAAYASLEAALAALLAS